MERRGRYPAETSSHLDPNFAQNVRLPKHLRGNLRFELFNEFDQMTPTAIFTTAYRDAPTPTGPTNIRTSDPAYAATPCVAGFNTVAVMSALNPAKSTTGRPDARTNRASAFQGNRTAQLKFSFSPERSIHTHGRQDSSCRPFFSRVSQNPRRALTVRQIRRPMKGRPSNSGMHV